MGKSGNNPVKSRIAYGDFIKAAGIVLVVMGHINSCNGLVKGWIYAFHMPLFFFATGVISANRNDAGTATKAFVAGKIKTLLVPYIIWGFVYSGFSWYNGAMLGYGSYYSIMQAGSLSSLWFLPVMFVAGCICEILQKSNKSQKLYPLFAVLLFAAAVLLPPIKVGYPFGFDTALLAAAFIFFGSSFEKLIKNIKPASVLLAAVSAGGFALTLLYRFNSVNGVGYVLMADMRIGNPLLFAVAAAGGCALVYALCRLAENADIKPLNRVLSFLGKNSLVIFVVHKPLISVADSITATAALPDTARMLVVTAAVLAVSSAAGVLINYFAPVLAGKKQ